MANGGLASIFSGLAQGFAQGQNAQLNEEFRQKEFKLKADIFKKKLEGEQKAKDALGQVINLITPQPAAVPEQISTDRPDRPGTGEMLPGARTAPQRSLLDILTDSQLQAAGLEAGIITLPQLLSAQAKQQEIQTDRLEALAEMRQQQQQQQNLERLFGAGGVGGDPNVRFEGFTTDEKGDMQMRFGRVKPEEAAGAAGIAELRGSLTEVGNFLTGGRELTADNVIGLNLSEFMLNIGQGAIQRDNMLAAAQLAFQRGGKALSREEARLVLEPLLPSLADIGGGFSLEMLRRDPAEVFAEGVSEKVIGKLKRIERLLQGQLSNRELNSLVQAAEKRTGARIGRTSPRLGTQQAVRPAAQVINFSDLPP